MAFNSRFRIKKKTQPPINQVNNISDPNTATIKLLKITKDLKSDITVLETKTLTSIKIPTKYTSTQ